MDFSAEHPTARDRELLSFLAEQRLTIAGQLAHWLGIRERSVNRRLARLVQTQLVQKVTIHGEPPLFHLTQKGMEAIGESMGGAGPRLNERRHDVGVGWVSMAARAGAFGEMTEVISERRMRSHDQAVNQLPDDERRLGGERPFALGLRIDGDRSLPSHYPDLLMRSHCGHTIAVELELTAKGRRRLDAVMDAYATEPSVDAVLYLVPDARMAGRVRAAAERSGISHRVRIRQIAEGRIGGMPTPAHPSRTVVRGAHHRGTERGRAVSRAEGTAWER